MSELEFDRDAVGVSAKRDWGDAESFASIGARFVSLPRGFQVAGDVPGGVGGGAGRLRSAVGSYVEKMRWVVMEYSDACATLGSGQAEAIGDFDETEYCTGAVFSRLSQRLG